MNKMLYIFCKFKDYQNRIEQLMAQIKHCLLASYLSGLKFCYLIYNGSVVLLEVSVSCGFCRGIDFYLNFCVVLGLEYIYYQFLKLQLGCPYYVCENTVYITTFSCPLSNRGWRAFSIQIFPYPPVYCMDIFCDKSGKVGASFPMDTFLVLCEHLLRIKKKKYKKY